jgi:hypothetical protein
LKAIYPNKNIKKFGVRPPVILIKTNGVVSLYDVRNFIVILLIKQTGG